MAHPVNHLLGQGRKMNYVLSHADATYDMRMADPTNTARHPANQYLLLDSADRLAISKSAISSVPFGKPNGVDLQPWNDFSMQRPQSLMEAFAKRIAVAEIRMPWFVPNVNSYNNGFSITTLSSATAGTAYPSASATLSPNTAAGVKISLSMGLSVPSNAFTVGQELLISSTTLSPAVSGTAFVLSWNSVTGILTFQSPIIPVGTWVGAKTDIWNVADEGTETTSFVTVPVGFYTPTALVASVQAQLTAYKTAGTFADAFTFSYDAATYRYSLKMDTNTSGVNYAILGYSNNNSDLSYLSDYQNWLSQANFFNLVGWPFSFSGLELFRTASGTGNPLVGAPSETIYTEFVDIVSSKAHEFTNIRDGNSGNTSTVAICRLYINDNVNVNESPWIGQTPIVIHRQFKNPKYIRFNAESVISWLDIQVLDSFGRKVPLPPPTTLPTNPASTIQETYPDFCITLLASED